MLKFSKAVPVPDFGTDVSSFIHVSAGLFRDAGPDSRSEAAPIGTEETKTLWLVLQHAT